MRLFKLHHHNLHNILHSDFWLFELSIWLFVFAHSLIAIFIPILLLNLGYSVTAVLGFYFIFNLIDTPLNFFSRWLITKIGAKWVMVIGTICEIIFFVILYNLTEQNFTLILLLAIFAALYDVFYWVSHLYIFIETNKTKVRVGKNTALLYRMKKIAGMLAPALGAVLLIFAGSKTLIFVSIIFFVLSVLPLLKITHIHNKPVRKETLSFKKFFRDKKEKKNYLSYIFYGIHTEAETRLWPVFIFLTIGTIESVASVAVIVSISAILFTYFLGNVKKKDREKMIILGSALVAFIWILRLNIDSTALYFLTIFLIGLFELLISIPLEANVITRAKEIKDPLSAMTYRNTAFMLVNTFFYGTLLVIINVFQVSFVMAILALLTLLLINSLFLSWKNKQPRVAT